jgi:hypothetical protein
MGRLKTWYAVAVAGALIEVALAILMMQRISTLKRVFLTAMANPTEQGVAAVERAGSAVDALTWPSLGAVVLSLVAIVGWMHSGAKAVSDGDLGLLRHSTGWAIGAWFVPLLNLVRVPQIAADLYRAGRSTPRAGLVIGAWWFLWLLDSISARVIMAQPEPQTPDAFVSAIDALGTSYWITIASAVSTIAMLTLVTTGLSGAAARPRAPQSPAAAPHAALWGPPAGEPDTRFGTPVPDARFGTPAPDPRFGAPAPDPRFGTPAPPAVPVPAGPPVGPPVAVPQAPPAAPPVAAPPAAAPAPPAPSPAPAEGASSPYPPTQTFLPE